MSSRQNRGRDHWIPKKFSFPPLRLLANQRQHTASDDDHGQRGRQPQAVSTNRIVSMQTSAPLSINSSCHTRPLPNLPSSSVLEDSPIDNQIPPPTARRPRRRNDTQSHGREEPHNRSESLHLKGGFFHNSHDVLFNGPVTMVDHTVEFLESSRVVIQRLAEKGMPAAIYNSSYRAYPPRCHKQTRQSIRTDIVEWSADPRRQRRMRWYLGPAGVGKSAIAQSVAEELVEMGWLGATFFFSRPGKVDDPDAVVPTLAYQLAMRHPRYKRLITERLGDDPLILDMDRPTQFRLLILEPFQIVALEDESSVHEPLLVIIDGLDECKDRAAQCELIRLINGDVSRTDAFPLLWMVCSRPEWHLKNILADVNSIIQCQQEEIYVDDGEAQADARRLLRTGLDDIRRRNHLPASWPPKEQVDFITRVASGYLGFVSFLIKFIEGTDDDDDDPCEQFRLCVKVASGPGIDPEAGNPLEALDRLYRQILSKVPSNVLPTAMRIIGLSILYSGHRLTAHDQARFLDIPQTTFQRSLKQLHSVIYIPAPAEAEQRPLRLYHASFSDFLRDPARSGDFCLDGGAVHLDVTIQSLPWLGRGRPEQPPGLVRGFGKGAHFSADIVWKACSKVPKELAPCVMSVLDQFDFGALELPLIDQDSFAEFIRWLYTQTPRSSPLITLVDGLQLTTTFDLDFDYVPPNPDKYCAVFLSGKLPRRLPMTLNVALGSSTKIQVGISVYANEAQVEAMRPLRQSLDEIRQQNHLSAGWPPREQVDLIARAASGHEGFMSSLIEFVNGTTNDDDNSCERFRLCVKVLGGSGIGSEAKNVLDALDRLFHLVLSRIPDDVLPTTMRILGLFILHSGHKLTAHDQAKFLDIPQVTFQRSLEQLHSVINVPPSTKAHLASLRMHHASFSQFLRDPAHSRDFCLDEDAVHLDVAIQSLSLLERAKSEKSSGLTKTPRGETHFPVKVWETCRTVPEKYVPALFNALERFDFGSLQLSEGDHFSFVEFIHWLYTRDTSRSLISLEDESQGAIPVLTVYHTARDSTAFSEVVSWNQPSVTLNFVLRGVTQIKVHVVVLWASTARPV